MAVLRSSSAWVWLALAGAMALLPVRGARANEGEVVVHLALLELGSEGVHDELARQLGEAVRREIENTPGHQLSDARVSLEQLSLVQDCEPDETSCLVKIAKRLGVSGFIFGHLQKEGGGAFAKLSLFDGASQTIKRTARTTFALRGASDAEIERKAESLVSQLLLPAEPPSSSPIDTTIPPLDPPLATEATLAPLESDDGLSTKRVAGYALLGGAALSVGLSVLAFVEIDRAQNNPSLDLYRRAVGREDPQLEDVCDAAADDRSYGLDQQSFQAVKDGCGAGRTFEVLQFIFLGAAAVSGGLSAYMLLSDEEAPRARRPTTLLEGFPVVPVVRRNAAEIRAKLRF